MRLQPVDGMVMPLQFHFGKYGVYFVVANFVQQQGRRVLAAFAYRYQVVAVIRFCQLPCAQGARAVILCIHVLYQGARKMPYLLICTCLTEHLHSLVKDRCA